MEKKGLCVSCLDIKTCIFSKEPPVWQCEEFSQGNNVPKIYGSTKLKRVVREAANDTE
jgi:hypothetical protein